MDRPSGDDVSLGSQLEGFRTRLERMIALRIDGRLAGRIEAADVVQDAFAEAIRRADDRPANMSSYLWVRLLTTQRLAQVLRFHVGAQQRDVAREQRTVPDASSMAMASAFLDSKPSPSQVAMGRENVARMQAALEKMGPMDREVLALRHFEELPNKDIAELLGLSEQAASIRYVRAIRKLRDALGES